MIEFAQEHKKFLTLNRFWDIPNSFCVFFFQSLSSILPKYWTHYWTHFGWGNIFIYMKQFCTSIEDFCSKCDPICSFLKSVVLLIRFAYLLVINWRKNDFFSLGFFLSWSSLTCFIPLVSFSTFCKTQKTRGYLMFSGDVERDQWLERG